MAATPDPSAARPGPLPRVEAARPADRGLVARLVEAVVAEDPSVAPDVAAGSVRAAQWLQRERPAWAGVAVLEEDGVRRVVGYVAASAGPRGARRVLLHPDHRDPALEAALLAAVDDALAAVPAPTVTPAVAPAATPAVVPPVVSPVVSPATRVAPPVVAPIAAPVAAAPARTTWRDRLLEPAGALAIVAAGVVALLAVQVGTGPLSDVVPFLGPDRDRESPAAEAEPAPVPDDGPSPTAPVAGVVLTPSAAPSPADPPAGAADPAGDPGGGPGTPPSEPGAGPAPGPGPGPATPPRESPGPTSALLDPVVEEAVEVLDTTTGDALAPVTGAVEDVVDGVTDVVDGVLGVVVPRGPLGVRR